MTNVLPYLKAVAAFVAPGVVILISATLAVSDGGETITHAELWTALAACFGTGYSVYKVPNKDRKGKHQRESVQPPGR